MMHVGVAVERNTKMPLPVWWEVKGITAGGTFYSFSWYDQNTRTNWKIKESGKINIAVLDYVAEHIKAGITTQQIDDWVYEQTTSRGAIPAPLNYEGFPKVFVLQSMIRYAMEFHLKMLFYRKVILSMLMYLLFIMVIFQILPECFVLVKFQKKRKS